MKRNEWISQAARWEAEGQAFALVTVLRAQAPTSGKAGDKAVVSADGHIHGWIGGGCAQPAVIKTVRRALRDGQARTIRISPSDDNAERELGDVLEFGMACHSGGTVELFVDPVLPAVTLTVVGDSPVARALVSLAPRVGFRVAVVAQDAQTSDFPDAAHVVASDEAQAVQAQLSSARYVVVATQGRRDMQGLKAALALQPQGLWFVASARKAAVLRDALVSSGEDAGSVARIVAPAGASIGAVTPEEIALSVLTSVVAARRGRGPADTAAPVLPAATAAVPNHEPATLAALAAVANTSSSGSCCGSKKSAAPEAALAGVPEAMPMPTAAALAATATGPGSCCGS